MTPPVATGRLVRGAIWSDARRLWHVCGLITKILFCSEAAADPTLLATATAQTRAALEKAPDGSPFCLPEITNSAEIHTVSTYAGGVILPGMRDQHAPALVDISVTASDAPVVVVASAYEPIIWSLTVAPDAKLAAVFLGGYYQPLVMGLPEGIPFGAFGLFDTSDIEKIDCVMRDGSDDAAAILNLECCSHFDSYAQMGRLREAIMQIGPVTLATFQHSYRLPNGLQFNVPPQDN